jgi:hypothetical protein
VLGAAGSARCHSDEPVRRRRGDDAADREGPLRARNSHDDARALVHMLAQGDCDCFEGRGVRLSAIQAVESNL